MKRIKFFTGRMMAVMLAWSLTMGSLSVPAFGAEVFEDMETAVETADEETAGDSSEAELQDKEEEKDPEKDTAVTEPDSNDDTGRKSDGTAADDSSVEALQTGERQDGLVEAPQTEEDQDGPVEAPQPGGDQDGDSPAEENADKAASGEPDELEHVDPQNPIVSDGMEESVSTDAEMGVVESGTCGQNLTWTLDENGLLTIRGKGRMYDYEDRGPWYNENIEADVEKVVISSGVTSIGNNAFASGSIESVEIPQTVTSIGEYAFYDNYWLFTVSIPKGVTLIGEGAFCDCDNLITVNLPGTLAGIGDSAFQSCSRLVNITIPDSVTEIGEYAFAECEKLQEITIPGGVKKIREGTFYECYELEKVVISKGVTDIERDAFYQCDCSRGVSIPSTVTGIGSYAFYMCDFTSLSIPGSVSGIGDYAFAYCNNLESIDIAEGVKKIGTRAFSYCDSLESVTIPSSVFYIGKLAFSFCDRLKDVTVLALYNTIDEEAFRGCAANLVIKGYAGTGTHMYCDEEHIMFEIITIPLSLADITVADQTYTGKNLTPAPTVMISSLTLKKGTDYTVSYKNNLNSGTATVTISGIGNYSGTKTVSFKINKASQTITVKSTASAIVVGKTATVSITGAKGVKSYKSSDTSVAAVNASTGLVTGKKAGTVTITATAAATENYKAASKTVKITVSDTLKKPGNCHFVKWNNSRYSSCRIGWNKTEWAEGYETLLSWTDGTHASSTVVKPNVLYRDCTVAVNHVSQMKVRAFYTANGKRVYSPWSNVEYITPSPTKLTAKKAGSGSNLKMNISWNIVYGCNGYNVFITTNPNGKWYWNQSTSEKATATSASIVKCGGAKLKKNTRYYVRIVTRRKRNGVFCTVPMPANNTYIDSFIIK